MPKNPIHQSLFDCPDYQLTFGAKSTLCQTAKRLGVTHKTLSHYLTGKKDIPPHKAQGVLSILDRQANALLALRDWLANKTHKTLVDSASINAFHATRNSGNGTLSKPL